MRKDIVRLWRRIRRHCVLCGAPRWPKHTTFCRNCNKAIMYATAYGIGPKAMRRVHSTLEKFS